MRGGKVCLYPSLEEYCPSRSCSGIWHLLCATQTRRYATAFGIVLVWSLTARADDYDRYDFSLRFPAAFSRFSSYASVSAIGNAQAASEWSSSVNPASAAWPHAERPYANNGSGQFSTLRFAEATDIYVVAEAAVLDANEWGVFVPGAAQVSSNHEQTSAGLGFEFEADYFQAQWGQLLAEDWAVGANFNYTATDTRFDASDAPLVRTRSDMYGFRIGALHRPLDALRVGLTLDYGWLPAWTDHFDPFGLGTGTVRSKDITQRLLARPGIVWQYAPHGNLYVDYQGGVFWNDTGTLWVHRFPIGVEHWLVPRGWVVRMGTTVDHAAARP